MRQNRPVKVIILQFISQSPVFILLQIHHHTQHLWHYKPTFTEHISSRAQINIS